jgi:hypothetical protein
MTTLHAARSGGSDAFSKGAAEDILASAVAIWQDGEPLRLTDQMREEVRAIERRMASGRFASARGGR